MPEHDDKQPRVAKGRFGSKPTHDPTADLVKQALTPAPATPPPPAQSVTPHAAASKPTPAAGKSTSKKQQAEPGGLPVIPLASVGATGTAAAVGLATVTTGPIAGAAVGVGALALAAGKALQSRNAKPRPRGGTARPSARPTGRSAGGSAGSRRTTTTGGTRTRTATASAKSPSTGSLAKKARQAAKSAARKTSAAGSTGLAQRKAGPTAHRTRNAELKRSRKHAGVDQKAAKKTGDLYRAAHKKNTRQADKAAKKTGTSSALGGGSKASTKRGGSLLGGIGNRGRKTGPKTSSKAGTGPKGTRPTGPGGRGKGKKPAAPVTTGPCGGRGKKADKIQRRREQDHINIDHGINTKTDRRRKKVGKALDSLKARDKDTPLARRTRYVAEAKRLNRERLMVEGTRRFLTGKLGRKILRDGPLKTRLLTWCDTRMAELENEKRRLHMGAYGRELLTSNLWDIANDEMPNLVRLNPMNRFGPDQITGPNQILTTDPNTNGDTTTMDGNNPFDLLPEAVDMLVKVRKASLGTALNAVYALRSLPLAIEAMSDAYIEMANRASAELPFHPQVGAALTETRDAFKVAIEVAEDCWPIARDRHEADINRLEDPRAAEQLWDIVSHGGAVTVEGPAAAAFRLLVEAEDMRDKIRRADIENAMTIVVAFDRLPEAVKAMSDAFAVLANRCSEEMPFHPDVIRAIEKIHGAFKTAIAAATEVGPLTRKLHAADIERIQNPRNGEDRWDFGAQD